MVNTYSEGPVEVWFSVDIETLKLLKNMKKPFYILYNLLYPLYIWMGVSNNLKPRRVAAFEVRTSSTVGSTIEL